jgi:hypothetical protein
MNKTVNRRHFDRVGGPEQLLLEQASGRLREIRALLVAIDIAELLADLPASAAARLNHQTGVSILAVMDRELQTLIEEFTVALAVVT